MTAETTFNQKLLRGGARKGQSAGRKANTTIGAMRKAPCAMRLLPGRRRQGKQKWQMMN